MILFDFILQFWRNTILLSRPLLLFLQVALCNQPTVVSRHWKWYRTKNFKPYSTPLWTIAFSTMTYTELWKNAEECTKYLGDTFHCRHTYIRQKFFNFIFPTLIDNPNNIKINALIRLVVNGMFLLPKPALLVSLASFPGNHL